MFLSDIARLHVFSNHHTPTICHKHKTKYVCTIDPTNEACKTENITMNNLTTFNKVCLFQHVTFLRNRDEYKQQMRDYIKNELPKLLTSSSHHIETIKIMRNTHGKGTIYSDVLESIFDVISGKDGNTNSVNNNTINNNMVNLNTISVSVKKISFCNMPISAFLVKLLKSRLIFSNKSRSFGSSLLCNITEIKFSNLTNNDVESIERLSNLLSILGKSSTTLKKVEIKRGNFRHDYHKFMFSLCSNKFITSLSFIDCNLDNETIDVISSGLSDRLLPCQPFGCKSLTLEELDLSENSLDYQVLPKLCVLLDNKFSIQKLSISKNRIFCGYPVSNLIIKHKYSCDFKLFLDTLSKNICLTSLSISSVGLDNNYYPVDLMDDSIKPVNDSIKLANVLFKMYQLTELDISNNRLSVESVIHMLDMLKDNTILEKLDITGNHNINEKTDVFEVLAETLLVNKTLREIYIKIGNIISIHSQKLMDALEINKSLNVIGMIQCYRAIDKQKLKALVPAGATLVLSKPVNKTTTNNSSCGESNTPKIKNLMIRNRNLQKMSLHKLINNQSINNDITSMFGYSLYANISDLELVSVYTQQSRKLTHY